MSKQAVQKVQLAKKITTPTLYYTRVSKSMRNPYGTKPHNPIQF